MNYLEVKMITEAPPAALRGRKEETDSALKLLIVLNRANRAIIERIRGSIEQHDLTLSEFAVLEVLYSKGRLLVGELGNRIPLTSGSTTYVIDKLEKAGLVVRRPSAEDRRALHVELTAKGRRLIGRIFPPHAEAIRRAMAGLTTEEKRKAIDLLKRLGRHAQERG